MIPEDRALLARLRNVGADIAAIVTGLLGAGLAEGCPPAGPLRGLADHMEALASDLRARADQLDNTVNVVEAREIEAF
jgi:hypothetical protein